MLNLDSIDSREDFKWSLIHKASKEPDFQSLLRRDPSAAVKQVLDIDTGLRVSVHQETPAEVFCLINYNPALPAAADNITIKPDDNNEAVMVKKAWKSADYRKRLLSDPAGTFRQEFGQSMPAGRELRVLEEGRNELQIILPVALADGAASAKASAELSDAELDTVSGGGVFSWLLGKLGVNPSSSGNTSHCGCNSSSGVRG